MRITLTVPGEPKAKQRPRWSKFGTYTDKKTVSYETYIKELFAIEHPDFKPMEGALAIRITAFLTIPKSVSEKKKRSMASMVILPTKRPDVDNIEKIVFDALESIAYKNDSQIVSSSIDKFYSYIPRLEIYIREII